MGWRWKKERLETQDIKTYVAPVILHIVNSFFLFRLCQFPRPAIVIDAIEERKRYTSWNTKWDIFFLGEMFQNRTISEQVQMYENMGNINIRGDNGIAAD